MTNSNGNNNGNNGMVRLGGLWKNQTKDGKSYLAGNFGGARIMVFQNGYKKDGGSEPDYIVQLAQAQPKKDKPQAQQTDDFGL